MQIRFPVNRIILPLVLAGLLLSAVPIAGCMSQPAGTTPGASSSAVTIGAIIKDPAAYEGKELSLKGKIAGECGSGCWFMLDDGTGQIYVDLAPNNFAIPQLSGSAVSAKGLIVVENGDPKLHATSVTTDTRSYP